MAVGTSDGSVLVFNAESGVSKLEVNLKYTPREEKPKAIIGVWPAQCRDADVVIPKCTSLRPPT